MPGTSYFVVFVTVPIRKSTSLSKIILNSRTAACINVISSVLSHYWWKRKIESTKESLLIIKTRRAQLGNLFQVIRENHPYSVPEIIALPIVKGLPSYLQFLENETRH